MGFLRHPFGQVAAVLAVAWFLIVFGIPYIPPLLGVESAPVPGSVVFQYMLTVLVGTLLWVSDNEERWARFKEPIHRTMVDDDRRVLGRLAPYPDARILVHNLGGNIPYEVERMDHRCLLDTPSEELPSARFRRAQVYVDCNSFGPRAIEAAVALYGAQRIVCGTDGTEFGCEWTSKALAEAQIGEEAREKILHGNAAALLSPLATLAPREQVAA